MLLNCKICKGCNLALDICLFNKHSGTKDGLRSKCKECRRKEHIDYRLKNPDKMKVLYRKKDKARYQNEEAKLKKRIRDKAWSKTESGKASIAASQKKCKTSRKRNPQNTKAKVKSARLWRQNNKDKANFIYARRRANKKNATPKWLSDADHAEILDFYTAAIMFKIYTGVEYHVDHIVPLSNPVVCGLHVPWNLRIITAKENLVKNNKFEQ